jgi:hypothetical protein
MKFLVDLVTDHDNDGDIVSVLGALGALTLIGLSIYSVIKSGTFDAVNFGTGIGLILAGLGGGYFSKTRAKP